MKFWCTSSNSSKQQKSMKKQDNSYATISSKSDSGYSDTSSVCSYVEQFLALEKIYYENLKHYIIKYSRPLRRYLNPDEILHLFQNIEKISTISESFIRQYQKLLTRDNIYQSRSNVMIDSYNSYISRSIQAQATLKQCQNKIAYFLQIPVETVVLEITEFILSPLRHISVLNELFQHYDLRNMIEEVNFLSKQASCVLQLSYNEQILELSSQDITSQSEIAPTVVFQRTEKEPWKSKRLELSDSRLSFTRLDESSANMSICLANVVHIEEDFSNEELCFIIASAMHKSSSSIRMKRVYVRFEDQNEYCLWLHHLKNAIQDAKDQSWSKTNELIL